MSSENQNSAEQKPTYGELFEAVKRDDIKATADLLERGAEVNAVCVRGNSVLMEAVNKSPALVSLLVDWGADPSKGNVAGYTPLTSVEDYLKIHGDSPGTAIIEVMEILKILREAPERHRLFVEKRTSAAAEAIAATAAETEEARQARSAVSRQLLRDNAPSKLRISQRPRP